MQTDPIFLMFHESQWMPDKENYRYSSNQKFTHDDIMKPSELTQYGISEKNLSESTIQYLEKNRLKK